MYYIAENLELRNDEVALRISDMTGRSLENCRQEVDMAIQRLFHWGAYADKYGGIVQVSLNNLPDRLQVANQAVFLSCCVFSLL